MQNTAMLRKAALDKKTIDMTYMKKPKKNQMAREVKDYKGLEVYQIDGDRLWAFDPGTGNIKQFIMHVDDPESGVMFVNVTEQGYEPRWDIKV